MRFFFTLILYSVINIGRFWAVPAVVLKKLVLGNFDTTYMDRDMVAAVNFMVLKVCLLSVSILIFVQSILCLIPLLQVMC